MDISGLQGSVALVTGVNNPLGIGAAVARALAGEGVRVVGTYLPLTPRACSEKQYGLEYYAALITSSPDGLVADIRRGGGSIDVVPADLANPAVVSMLFDRAREAFGDVDILVNNAAVDEPDTLRCDADGKQHATVWDAPVGPFTIESYERHFSVNTRAVALMMAEFARRHVARGATRGRIINVSTDGAPGFASEVSYGASKHAMESFSRAAAKEFGACGITVNVVSPGPIQTGWIAPALEERLAAETPLGRIGRPEDVADVIVFLASDSARWLTGQVLYVGGGRQMSH